MIHKFRISLFLVLLPLFLLGAENKDDGAFHNESGHFCFGIGPQVGIRDGGLHIRTWINNMFGLTIKGYSDWDTEAQGGIVDFAYKPALETKVSPYVLFGAGLHYQYIDTTFNSRPYKTFFYSPTFEFLIGGEWRFDRLKKQALSLEAGYFYGQAEYPYTSTPMGSAELKKEEVPYTIQPLKVNLLYTYYFCKEPVRDTDGDGILDTADNCPNDPEDKDGFEDLNGCPDPDNDKDQILDKDDGCPNDPEDRDGFEDEDGCVDPDNDKDGIWDASDACPNDPEDMDGFEDSDGCPELDNDKDGIFDAIDSCPNDPETMNEYKDEDGCPDEKPKTAFTISKAPIVLEGVTFNTGLATLKPSSYEVLDKVVESLRVWDDVIIEIQGHTDSVGSATSNQKLSYERARTVKGYLVDHGISEDRLKAVGYGEEEPIATNSTAEGRQQNRRVTMQKIGTVE